MKLEQWIIALVTGILIFLITYFIGQVNVLPSILVGLVVFLGVVINSTVGIKKRKK